MNVEKPGAEQAKVTVIKSSHLISLNLKALGLAGMAALAAAAVPPASSPLCCSWVKDYDVHRCNSPWRSSYCLDTKTSADPCVTPTGPSGNPVPTPAFYSASSHHAHPLLQELKCHQQRQNRKKNVVYAKSGDAIQPRDIRCCDLFTWKPTKLSSWPTLPRHVTKAVTKAFSDTRRHMSSRSKPVGEKNNWRFQGNCSLSQQDLSHSYGSFWTGS